MKKKAEIKDQIKLLYALKSTAKKAMKDHGYSVKQLKEPFQIVDYNILALKWTLGYKTNYKSHHYWCFKCHIMHQDSTCPNCGGNEILHIKAEK